jgi:hypothetical protein
VGKTQIYDILKNKIKIKDEWLVHTLKEFLFLDHWYRLKLSKKIGKHNFKASNGWLESFTSPNIVFNAVCGEANDVDMQTVADWKGKTEDLVAWRVDSFF